MTSHSLSSATTSSSCLEWLIHPVSPRFFFQKHWAVSPLLIQRNEPDYFQSLLTLNGIDQAIASLSLTFPGLCLVNASREIKKEDYVRPGNSVDVDALYQEFADGSTIILSQLQANLPSLANLCRNLEREFSFPFQTNIYLTPSRSKGFKCHYDTHDVFILQVSGSKHWRLYGTPVQLPLYGQEFDAKTHAAGEITMEANVSAGDVLYIPRGTVHDAESTEETSLHITVGILAYTWADLLAEALCAVFLKNVAFRRPLPIGFAHDGFDMTEARGTFANLITLFADSVEFDESLDCFVEQFVQTRKPELSGQMHQLRRLGALTLDTTVGVRPQIIYRLIENSETVDLHCHGKKISFPPSARQSLGFALGKASFKVRDIPGFDADSQLVFVKRLVREGVLRQL